VTLTKNQTATIGSPATASSTNTEPVQVELVDGSNVAFGSLWLDPSESVDVHFAAGNTVNVNVLLGSVTITVGSETAILSQGQTESFTYHATNVAPIVVLNPVVMVDENGIA